MAIGGVSRALGDVARGGNDAANVVKVFANGWTDWNAEFALFESNAELRIHFDFEALSETAEFDFAVSMLRRIVVAEIAGKIIAEANSGAGVVEADALGGDESRVQRVYLFW